ncbi:MULTISPECIES: acyl-ACP desaturase [Gordonia]|uniref:acyl-ACP desaturase n=1 Tax=Gordonia TaxID=2053 RepID=UPI0002A623EF|nr:MULTISPECIES: acyl-ACP desaturase [Gordonia]ATD73003.1 acyl-ACP desaturase [Gordonia sp. 1D]MBA5848714.1 acyl-ACP desaturase [Gordonia amicalis]MDJ0451377.1 acyl-ACP desaturase [Gordonia amicalis]MDV7076537.1 acyl-ACP desaturase [Gordonia amicalis]MDV7175628.1 acyl-ACP desaturase [Gordonia amicalis]
MTTLIGPPETIDNGMTGSDLLRELLPVCETEVERHMRMTKDWHPHDYVPWDEGRNFAMLGGIDWDPEQSQLSETAKAAMITNLLTEDNLPSYHRVIAQNFSLDDAWGWWVGRWTAEENRHSVVMRDYLVVTRGVDPVELEEIRMAHMTAGFNPLPEDDGQRDHSFDMLFAVAYVSFQELATRVSHRNTGKACGDPIADRMLQRVAADENLHMLFYRNIVAGALDLVPDQTMAAIYAIVSNFQMPGATMPNFRRNAVLIAKGGIYDLPQHMSEVVMPVLRKWRIFERDDFGPLGEHYRELLADFLEQMNIKVEKFEASRERALQRERARGRA